MIIKTRCPWLPFDKGDKLYIKYHDKEWGVPVILDKKLYEFLVLEAFQAGLSWRTVLHKRENFRKAFARFDPKKVFKFGNTQVKKLMNNDGIIRNRLKILAAIENAKRFLEVQKEFGSFAKYQWGFVKGKPIVHKLKIIKDYPVKIKEAENMATDMKKRGFKFLGPTVLYAHMQACGMVNDHIITCFRHNEVKKFSSLLRRS